jgi:DNA helicase II / ATP-dependent DNA helicase PcrA
MITEFLKKCGDFDLKEFAKFALWLYFCQMDYLQGLNNEQKEAVLHTEGPLMIIAGAGSGKTKVLTTRTAHLLHKGVEAFNILALTFTNKAAAEMKERITKILGNNEAKNLYMGTFHSVFAKILRFEADHLGYPKNFTIYDTEDAKSVLKQIVKEQQLDEKIYKPSFVYNRISSAKNNLIGPGEYATDTDIQVEDARNNRPAIGTIYKEYAQRCFRNGAMDFDDLLMNMYILLRRFPEVLARYQHRFKYLMIDEYQDTNLAQYHIIKLMAAVHENICVVGDDAQSIYSFRGASMQNIFQFQKDYTDLHTIKLEQNYRSTKTILHTANSVINNNKNQIPKELWTENESGEKINVNQSMSDNDEGKMVAEAILENKMRYHYKNQDFAILYRTNAQSRSFEESLRRLNIDYKIYGGMSFYQRKEVKDIVAYLRAVVNPQDEEAIRRIINIPARGIGNTSLQKIGLFANTNNISFWESVQKANEVGLKGASLMALENFVLLLKSNQSALEKKNAYEVAIQLSKQSGLLQELHADKTVEGLARFENVETLLNSIKEFTETPNEDGELTDKSLGSYLQQITLLTDADNENDEEDRNVVKLMTIHAAKGLEFPCVFVVGVEENMFPSQMSLYDRESLDEERRLFYVAITRAKQRLWITLAKNRYRFGSLINNEPSRFVAELPENMISKKMLSTGNAGGGHWDTQSPRGFGQSKYNSSGNNYGKQNQQEKTVEQKKVVVSQTASTHVASSNFAPSNPSEIQQGMKVEHQRFGFGTVSAIEGGVADRKAKIIFENGIGEKMMMLNFAKLMVVNS